MNITFLITIALLLIAAMWFLIPKLRESRWIRRGGEWFANALIVNITPKGRGNYLADNAFTARYLLAKVGTDATHIDICTAADIPLGVVPDMTPSTETATGAYPLPVNILGLNEDTERMIASGVIALGAFVVADAAGKVRTLPGTTGTYYIIGRAKTAAAANNDQIEVIPCFPIQRVVP